MWRRHEEPFPLSYHATLAYQRKRPGQPWEEPRVLVVAPFSEYSIFYHRLTTDQTGRLFLSYDYWSTYWFYRTDHWGNRRALIMSSDGGETWWEFFDLPDGVTINRLAVDGDWLYAEPHQNGKGLGIFRTFIGRVMAPSEPPTSAVD